MALTEIGWWEWIGWKCQLCAWWHIKASMWTSLQQKFRHKFKIHSNWSGHGKGHRKLFIINHIDKIQYIYVYQMQILNQYAKVSIGICQIIGIIQIKWYYCFFGGSSFRIKFSHSRYDFILFTNFLFDEVIYYSIYSIN